MTVFILDNATVAMTGGQEVFATGDTLIRIMQAFGVNPDHIFKIEPRQAIRSLGRYMCRRTAQQQTRMPATEMPAEFALSSASAANRNPDALARTE